MAAKPGFQLHDYRGSGRSSTAIPALLTLNVICYVLQVVAQDRMDVPGHDAITAFMSMVSPRVLRGELWRLVTYMFAHADHFHIFWNMYGLLIFGRGVEAALGTRRFYLLYFVSGLTGGLLHLVFNLGSPIPMLGASGAVLGVTAAAALLFPLQELLVMCVLPMTMRSFAICFAVISLLMALSGGAGGVAHLAHLGGMVAGFVYVRRQQGGGKGFFESLLPARRDTRRRPSRPKGPLHRCESCGLTEMDDPNMGFRVCSQCAGGKEFCEAHIADHSHE